MLRDAVLRHVVRMRALLTLADIAVDALRALIARYGLQLCEVPGGTSIPGSFWGDPEAGIIGNVVHARGDTPVHSLLHEAAHLIVLPVDARAAVHTDATDSIEEENAVCVLQVLLGEALPGVGAGRVLADMDAWGYTFRLGSAAAYVYGDADDAWAWLAQRGLVDAVTRTLLAAPSAAAAAPMAARPPSDTLVHAPLHAGTAAH